MILASSVFLFWSVCLLSVEWVIVISDDNRDFLGSFLERVDCISGVMVMASSSETVAEVRCREVSSGPLK